MKKDSWLEIGYKATNARTWNTYLLVSLIKIIQLLFIVTSTFKTVN